MKNVVIAAMLLLIPGTTLASPPLAPVPLVPPTITPAPLYTGYARVRSYHGSYVANISSSSYGGWHERVYGTVTLVPICASCPQVGTEMSDNFRGITSVNETGQGFCGTGTRTGTAQVLLHLTFSSGTYSLYFVPNIGGVALKGGSSTCTQPYADVFPAASLDVLKAAIPASAASGICGDATFHRSGSWGTENDTLRWRLAPNTYTNLHWACTHLSS